MKFVQSNIKTFAVIFIALVSLSSLAARSKTKTKTKTKGNFSATCRNTQLSGANLQSECRMIDGNWMRTQVFLGNCVTNNNGNLTGCGTATNSIIPSTPKPIIKPTPLPITKPIIHDNILSQGKERDNLERNLNTKRKRRFKIKIGIENKKSNKKSKFINRNFK